MEASMDPPVVLAAASHPDDIEFLFAGTLLLLKQAGCKIHMWNLANGCCGTRSRSREEIIEIRRKEAEASAALAGAVHHDPVFNDLEIFYDKDSLRVVSDVVRSVQPQIILTHSLHDYMEDHQNVCRLIVTAAFSRNMPNFAGLHATFDKPVRIYHAAPHGLRDGLEAPFRPDFLINIESTLAAKRQMLACHRSQGEWLETSQGLSAWLDEMIEMSHAMARDAQGINYAEGWKLHSHLGFCPPDFDPLPAQLRNFFQNST